MGRGAVNIKYKRIFKLFFFVVIFFVLLGLCTTTKTYAAKAKTYAVKNVFPSCSTGGKIGYTDVETGDTGVVTIPVAWAKKPPTTEKTAGTTWDTYRKEQTINITKAVDKKIGNLKIHIDKQQIKTVNCTSIPGTGVSSKNYLYAVIPIDVTMPAGYFFNRNYTHTGLNRALFSYSTSPKGINSETAPINSETAPANHCFRTTKNEEHVCRSYLILNVQYLGLITNVKEDSYNSGDAMLKVDKYTNYYTYEMQLMPYEIEYNPGVDSDAESGNRYTYTDKAYISKDTKLRNATYRRRHYHQIGWEGYSQYAIVNSDATSATQGKHNEEYSLNEIVTAPYSADGIFRKKHRGFFGENAGCEGIDETTESKIVLEPKWDVDSYTINYDPNGGKLKPGVTEADCTQKVKYDNEDKLRDYEPYIENPYGRFKGWSTDPTGTRILHPGNSIDNIDVENNGTITLYAIWYTEFTIRLSSGAFDGWVHGLFPPDASTEKNIDFDYGDILTSVDIPVPYPGWRFAGFYTEPGTVEGKGNDYEQMVFDAKGNIAVANITTRDMIIKNGQLLSKRKRKSIDLYAKYTEITNASCSEDSATIPNIPVNPPSDSDRPASENLHLKILKKDQNTEKLLDGAVFSLQGTGDNSDFSVERTTIYGVANFDLSNAKAGEYKLTETKAPDGYKTSDSSCPWTFTLEVNTVTDSKGVKHEIRRIKGIKDKNGEKVNTPTLTDDSYNCTIYNTSKKQTLKITKKDSKTGDPLTGAVFRLTGPNGYNEERRVDISGVVKFEDLEPGDYELKETTVPVGYILSGKIYAVKVTENDVTITEK